MAHARVVACVATNDRPAQLTRCLDSLARQVSPIARISAILVVDASDTDSAHPTSVAFAEHNPTIPVEYRRAPRAGYATARNHLLTMLKEEDAEFFAFIDDDEEVDQRWLGRIVAYAREERCAIVAGPVVPRLPPTPPPPRWFLARGHDLPKPPPPPGHFVPTGNLLVSLSAWRQHRLMFDTAFDAIGGEDSDWTLSHLELGLSIGYCEDALVYEDWGDARMHRRYWRVRAYRSGQSEWLRIRKRLRRSQKRASHMIIKEAIPRVGSGLAMAAVGVVARDPALTWRGEARAVRGMGFFAAEVSLHASSPPKPLSHSRGGYPGLLARNQRALPLSQSTDRRGKASQSVDECSLILSVASLGSYRLAPIQLLIDRLGKRLCIYAGTTSHSESLKVLTSKDAPLEELRNVLLPRGLFFQFVPVRRYLRAECVVLDLNPRALHVWLILLARKLLARRTLLWGHAWPRAGRHARSEAVRRRMRGLASGLVTYTSGQARELKLLHPHIPVFTAPNALLHHDEMGFVTSTERRSIVYVGRLIESKKPELLISAFGRVASEIPDVELVVVGDGPLRRALELQASAAGLCDRVAFTGHVECHARLRDIYAKAVVSVSPGYLGLSGTQSFGFGVPMIIASDEPHAPEVELARAGFNSVFVTSNDPSALAQAIERIMNARDEWHARGPAIAAECAAFYSVERMVDGLAAALLSR